MPATRRHLPRAAAVRANYPGTAGIPARAHNSNKIQMRESGRHNGSCGQPPASLLRLAARREGSADPARKERKPTHSNSTGGGPLRQGNSGPSGARPRPVWAWMPLRRHDHRICTARRPATTRVRFSNASQKQRALSTPGRVPHIVGVLRAWVHLQHSGERKPNHPQRRRDQYALARGPAYAAMPFGSLSAMGAGIPSSPSHQCTTSSFEQRWLYSDPTILLFSMGPNLPHAAKLPLLPCPSLLFFLSFFCSWQLGSPPFYLDAYFPPSTCLKLKVASWVAVAARIVCGRLLTEVAAGSATATAQA